MGNQDLPPVEVGPQYDKVQLKPLSIAYSQKVQKIPVGRKGTCNL